MQNRWFGEKNDYFKYSVIRHLLAYGSLRVAVNWMLMPDAGNLDLSKTSYLRNPKHHFRSFDPYVFDYLQEQVVQRKQFNVSVMALGGPIANCQFFDDYVPQDQGERQRWFNKFLSSANGIPVMFFDPDTGIERDSSKGKDRVKFICWDELRYAYGLNHTLLIYQHRDQGLSPRCSALSRLSEIQEVFPDTNVWVIYSSTVAFFLLGQPPHFKQIEKAVVSLKQYWRAYPVSVLWP